MQHEWAQLSEKLADVIDPTIKYGGGSSSQRNALELLSRAIASLEHVEATIVTLAADGPVEGRLEPEVGQLREAIGRMIERVGESLAGEVL